MVITDLGTVLHDDCFNFDGSLVLSDTVVGLSTEELKALVDFLYTALGLKTFKEVPYCVTRLVNYYDNFSGALLVKAIKEYLLEICNTKEESINQLKANKEKYANKRGYALYEQGWILPYYHQIMELYDRVGRYYDSENTDDLRKDFEKHIEIAVDEILKEAENEVK